MALSIRDIVCRINERLEPIFSQAKFYGVATSVEREGKTQPVVNEHSVAFDNSYSMQMYHKINGITKIEYRAGEGRTQNTINTFSMSGYVFNNEKSSNLKADEIAMILQALISNINISSARILPASVILNTPQIFATEYRGVEYALSEKFTLMQFNYNIEITFKSGCFDLCPEDFSSCKN